MSKSQNKAFVKMFEKDLILLDGAMGTELEKSIPNPKLPWSLDGLIYHPERVQAIHERYLQAGADMITINAFRTNQRTLNQVNWDDVEPPPEAHSSMKTIWKNKDWDQMDRMLTQTAARIAQNARQKLGKTDVCVAGNLTTVEDCFSPEKSPPFAIAYKEHRRKAIHLAESGVDLILIETINTIAEGEAALQACLETGLPVWISFVINGKGTLINGDSVADTVNMLKAYPPSTLSAVLFNCCFPEEVDAVLPTLAQLIEDVPLRFGAYANVESPDETGLWRRRIQINSASYLEHVTRWVEMGASIVGGCCGTTPQDIQILHQGLRSLPTHPFLFNQ